MSIEKNRLLMEQQMKRLRGQLNEDINPKLKALTGKKVKSVAPGEVGGIVITFTDGTELEFSNNMITLNGDLFRADR